MEKSEIIEILRSGDVQSLSRQANLIRETACGRKVYFRGLIEFSNYCVRDCLYCGLRRSNRKLKRYRLTVEEIMACCRAIAESGIKTVVLQSGDDFGYQQAQLIDLINQIKTAYPDMAITLSLGERDREDYRLFREAGADRYLLKHETIQHSLYQEFHPGQSLRYRLRILFYLKELGYQVGTGIIVGLPSQTLEDLAEDLLFLQGFKPDMIGIGPFIPQKDTPLGRNPSPSLELVLKCLGLIRILTRDAHLPATTAVATLGGLEAQRKACEAGCNVIMINFTPPSHHQDYRVYDDKFRVDLRSAMEVVSAAGMIPSLERGDSLQLKEMDSAKGNI
ncbi:MAG: [FeFe] hydrogenase H-cluster radical SAM maturase HydE [Candidatus Omnitrophica bacterium]|nr:[FeFe] hydrogenase H-cluster radical SAM maturase HydE [Candidatus Omnitrophota bacterium]